MTETLRKAPCGSLGPAMLASHEIFSQKKSATALHDHSLVCLEKIHFYDLNVLRVVFTE